MISKEVMVNNPTGLHARPATMLVKKASQFKCDISLELNGKKANVKSLIGVLSLGVVKGSLVKVNANGEDEARAVDEIVALIEELNE